MLFLLIAVLFHVVFRIFTLDTLDSVTLFTLGMPLPFWRIMDINIILAVLAITFCCTRRDTASVIDYPPGLAMSTDNKGLIQDIYQQAPG